MYCFSWYLTILYRHSVQQVDMDKQQSDFLVKAVNAAREHGLAQYNKGVFVGYYKNNPVIKDLTNFEYLEGNLTERYQDWEVVETDQIKGFKFTLIKDGTQELHPTAEYLIEKDWDIYRESYLDSDLFRQILRRTGMQQIEEFLEHHSVDYYDEDIESIYRDLSFNFQDEYGKFQEDDLIKSCVDLGIIEDR